MKKCDESIKSFSGYNQSAYLDNAGKRELGDTGRFLASPEKRILNFLIDLSVSSLIAYLLFESLHWLLHPLNIGNSHKGTSAFVLFAIIIYITYAYLMEHYTGGKTIGKYITATSVVNLHCKRADAQTLLLRSLIRIIPFEPFSFLTAIDQGWHDKWTGTRVVEGDPMEAEDEKDKSQ